MAAGSREVWAKRVARWRASGLTAAEFARRHRLAEASLKWWKWKLGSTRRAPAPVSPLTFVEMTAPMRRESLELVLASGVEVRVPADFDEGALARLLDMLDRRR
jgi:transposase